MRLKKLFELFVSQCCVFYNCLQGIGIQSFMIRNGYAMNSIGHAYMLFSCYNLESNFTECLNRTLGRDISKKNFRQEPLSGIQLNLWFPLQSSGGMF